VLGGADYLSIAKGGRFEESRASRRSARPSIRTPENPVTSAQGGRLVGDIMKTHKGQVEAGDVKRIAEELLRG